MQTSSGSVQWYGLVSTKTGSPRAPPLGRPHEPRLGASTECDRAMQPVQHPNRRPPRATDSARRRHRISARRLVAQVGAGDAERMTGMPGTTMGRGGSGVLEDPTGMRARWMRRAGRLIFLVFLGWLLAIVLGGLGLMPVAGIPLTHVLRPSQGPPPLSRLPKPRQPSVSDLEPAVPAKGTVAPARITPAGPGRSAVAPGHTKKTPAASPRHGKSTSAPGHTKTATVAGSHGKSTVAPGQTKTTPVVPAGHGTSTVAPGQTKTTTVAGASHGKSAIAPGQTTTAQATRTPVRRSKRP